MASDRFNQLAAIWRAHGERIMLGVLLLLFGVGVMYAIQVKGEPHFPIIERIAGQGGPGGPGVTGAPMDPQKVFATIDTRVDRKIYLNIPTRNVFRTPQERAALSDKLVAAYSSGIEHYNAQRYKIAVEKFREVLTEDPEQVLADYGQGNPAEFLQQAEASMKIEELAQVWDQAKGQWQRAQEFESQTQPISAANTYREAVRLYQQSATEGQGLVSEDGLTEAKNRVEQGTQKVNTLLSTYLSQDVRDKLSALAGQLGGATMAIDVMIQVHKLVTEIDSAIGEYSEHIQDDVEQQAAAAVNQATEAIARNAVGLYQQTLRVIQDALGARDTSRLGVGIARLRALQSVQSDLPSIDRNLGQAEQFLLKLQREEFVQMLDAELARLRQGINQLSTDRRNENWTSFEANQRNLLKDRAQMLDLAQKLQDRGRGEALNSLYQNIASQAAPKEIDFLRIDSFPQRGGVYLIDTTTGNRSSFALKKGGNWLASQPNAPSRSVQVVDVNARAGTVQVKADNYRTTTLKK